jgi:MYXO-CTERM domain-containing protein
VRLSLLAALVLCAPVAAAQIRHRRPVAAAPDIRYGFDNNGGTGCRDYTCGARCYDGHSGTDISVAVGTAVLASADGTVVATNNGCANYGYVGNPCGGRCGNYVQLEHADGSRTVYCHMQLNSVMVSRGQRVRCGAQLGRSASSGSSSGPHLHFGWKRSASAASQDPFRGRCASGPVVWTEQRAYPGISGATCACVPSAETCNGRDDDCDGRVDDGLTRDCYTGPAGTRDRGVCRAGSQSCANGNWGACGGEVLPRAEVCNRADDDCDGRVDDGVCVMDAGVRADVPADVRVEAGADVRVDVSVVDRPSTDVARADVGTDDAGTEDDAGTKDDAGFEDVGPEGDADDVAPDREDPQETGCGCRAVGARNARGVWGLALTALALLRRRRRDRSTCPPTR